MESMYMETHQLMAWRSNYDIDENPYPLTNQFSSYSYDQCRGNANDGYFALDSQYEFSLQDSNIPFMECYYPDRLYETLPTVPAPSVQDYDFYDVKKAPFVWNEIDAEFDSDHKPVVSSYNGESGNSMKEDLKDKKRFREEKSCSARILTRKVISQYFYMPITEAAKELNVGLTLFKKRCRELGIHRWPHRKLMSLQTLIENIQEQGEEGQGGDEKIKNAIEILEKEKKKVEEMPDLQLEDSTKRLRQACFKANYKKRRQMVMGLMEPQSSSQSNSARIIDTRGEENYIDEHDIKHLLLDPHSTCNKMFWDSS